MSVASPRRSPAHPRSGSPEPKAIERPPKTNRKAKKLDLRKELRNLNAQLAADRDAERETLAQISKLEIERQQMNAQRRLLLENARRMDPKTSPETQSLTSKLRQEVENLSSNFSRLSIQHQEMRERATETEIATKRRLLAGEQKVKDARDRLDYEKSSQVTRLKDIEVLKTQIAEAKAELADITKQKGDYETQKREVEEESDKVKVQISEEMEKMQLLKQELEDARRRVNDLTVERDRRIESRKKQRAGNQQLNEVMEVLDELREKRKSLRGKVRVLEEEEVPRLTDELERITLELNRLVRANEERQWRKGVLQEQMIVL